MVSEVEDDLTPLIECITAIHNGITDDIDKIYDEVIRDLNSQRKALHIGCDSWSEVQSERSSKYYRLAQHRSSDCDDDDEKSLRFAELRDETSLHLDKILKVPATSNQDIATEIYPIIRAQIEQTFKQKQQSYQNNLIQTLSNMIDEQRQPQEEATSDYQGMNDIYNYKSVLSQFTQSNHLYSFVDIALFYYDENEWKNVGKGQLTLYNEPQSGLKYIAFRQLDKIISFQAIDSNSCDFEQKEENCVHWTASDWVAAGTTYPFYIQFKNFDDVVFTQFMRQTIEQKHITNRPPKADEPETKASVGNASKLEHELLSNS